MDKFRRGSLNFSTLYTWDAERALASETVAFSLTPTDKGLAIEIQSPYHDDPRPPGPVGPCWGLWEYEVVEIFLAGRDEAYTELELGPHGHHLILRFKERRKPWAQELPLNYRAELHHGSWSGSALMPWDYLPSPPYRINLYAIHGLGLERRYLAAYPVPGEKPDFHRLEFFEAISFGRGSGSRG